MSVLAFVRPYVCLWRDLMPTYPVAQDTGCLSLSEGVLRAWESCCLLFWRRCQVTTFFVRETLACERTWVCDVSGPSFLKGTLARISYSWVALSSVEWCGTVGREPCTYRSNGIWFMEWRIDGKLSDDSIWMLRPWHRCVWLERQRKGT